MNSLILLDSVQAQIEWEEAAKYLRKAVLTGEPDKELHGLRVRVANGLSHLWKVQDEAGRVFAWATTYFYAATDGASVAQITMAASDDLYDFVEMLGQFEEWAKLNGADRVEVIGREGWKRVLRPHGFSHNYTSFIKEVYTELH